jgi:hypothetical protein
MLAWFRKRQATAVFSPTEEQWLHLQRQLESLQARQGDLVERFNLFQNREGMRQARAAKGNGDTEIQHQAAALLAKRNPSEPTSTPDANKLDLWSLIG